MSIYHNYRTITQPYISSSSSHFRLNILSHTCSRGDFLHGNHILTHSNIHLPSLFLKHQRVDYNQKLSPAGASWGPSVRRSRNPLASERSDPLASHRSASSCDHPKREKEKGGNQKWWPFKPREYTGVSSLNQLVASSTYRRK